METTNQKTDITYSYHTLQEEEKWKECLQQHGFVVLKGVLNGEEVAKVKDLFWSWLEGLGSGIKRDDVRTWKNENMPGNLSLGFMTSHGGSHSEASWFARSHPNVKQAFASIWNTQDLLVSMDIFICWRPWWLNPYSPASEAWEPYVEGPHLDQNPFFKQGMHCIQGMIPMMPVTKETGGLGVAPDTHLAEAQEHLINNYPNARRSAMDWLLLRSDDPYRNKCVLVEASPGDLILWDSRLIHTGIVGPGPKTVDPSQPPELPRLSLAVCMTPASKATRLVLNRRVEAFQKGHTLTHWPHEYIRHTMPASNGLNIKSFVYQPIPLTEEQKKLISPSYPPSVPDQQ